MQEDLLFSDEVFKELIKLLKQNHTIERLTLGSFDSSIDALTGDLDRALEGNTTLHYLSLEPQRFSNVPIDRNLDAYLTLKKTIFFRMVKLHRAAKLDKYVFKAIFKMLGWEY
jgi:hypothetical protein